MTIVVNEKDVLLSRTHPDHSWKLCCSVTDYTTLKIRKRVVRKRASEKATVSESTSLPTMLYIDAVYQRCISIPFWGRRTRGLDAVTLYCKAVTVVLPPICKLSAVIRREKLWIFFGFTSLKILDSRRRFNFYREASGIRESRVNRSVQLRPLRGR